MSNPLQDFLTLSYTELEELNLQAKEQRKNRVPKEQVQEERLKYLDRREADQGCHGAVQRPRRPPAHARL